MPKHVICELFVWYFTVITPIHAVCFSSKPSWADQVEEEGDEGEKLN